MVFEEVPRFGETFTFEGKGGFVFLRTRSMVAGLMDRSFALMSAVIPKANHWAIASICCRIRGARSSPHLYQKKVQMRWRER
jgi:hypothetical protein